MASFKEGQKVAVGICEALGLDPSNVYSLSLVCHAGEATYVDVGMFVTGEGIDKCRKAVKRYKLVPKDED